MLKLCMCRQINTDALTAEEGSVEKIATEHTFEWFTTKRHKYWSFLVGLTISSEWVLANTSEYFPFFFFFL